MHYYCDVCNRTIESTSKRSRRCSKTRKRFEQCIRKKHTIQKPENFDIDEVFNEYITSHNKKLESYLGIIDFKLIFHHELSPQITSDLEINLRDFLLKRSSILWVEYFIEKRYMFNYISEMCITTVNNNRYTTYQKYRNRPKQLCE